MKRKLFSALAAMLALSVTAVTATAQDDAAEKRALKRAAQQGTTGALDSKTSAGTVRASQLIGMNIQNDQEESVGEIKDFVLDTRTGRVRYVAVTYGGFLGVGNKMFAVPFEAFQAKHDPDDPDDPDDYVLVLNVTQSQLDGATGFAEDHWPNFADRTFTRELDQRYGVERKMRANQRNRTRAGAADAADEDDVEVDDEAEVEVERTQR